MKGYSKSSFRFSLLGAAASTSPAKYPVVGGALPLDDEFTKSTPLETEETKTFASPLLKTFSEELTLSSDAETPPNLWRPESPSEGSESRASTCERIISQAGSEAMMVASLDNPLICIERLLSSQTTNSCGKSIDDLLDEEWEDDFNLTNPNICSSPAERHADKSDSRALGTVYYENQPGTLVDDIDSSSDKCIDDDTLDSEGTSKWDSPLASRRQESPGTHRAYQNSAERDDGIAEMENEQETNKHDRLQAEGGSSPRRKTAVIKEIEIMQQLEKGPTEAEVRRRKLIEIDEDTLEEQIIQLRKNAMKVLKTTIGKDAALQRRKLRNCKNWIREQYSKADDDVKDWIEAELQLNQSRLLTSTEQEVQFEAYLKSTESPSESDQDDSDIDSSRESNEEVTDTKNETIGMRPTDPSSLIELSDDEDADFLVDVSKLRSAYQAAGKSKHLRAGPGVRGRIVSEREKLKNSLRRKVIQTASANLSRQLGIDADKLALKTEVTEKCRLLIDLLRDRTERNLAKERAKAEADRAARRLMYEQQAHEGDDEFDDDFAINNVTKVMSEEEKRALLKAFNEENAEEDFEEIEEDGQQDHDVEEDEEKEGIEEPADENSGNDDDSGDVGNIDEDGLEDIADEDKEHVDDRDTRAEVADHIKQHEEADRPPPCADDVTLVENESMSNHSFDTKEPNSNNEEKSSMLSKRSGSGNSEYRKMLEAEERRHKKEKGRGSRLVELEAEEEEEEGRQAGLGDFGFGRVDFNQDDEAEATKLRKGDLDHIVDEADEGDEAAAEQARLNQLIAQDRQNTKAVIEGITNGYDPTRRNGKKGKYTWDKLASARDERELLKPSQELSDHRAEDDDFDEEEMLQRGMELRAENMKRAKYQLFSDGSSSDDDSDDDDPEIADELTAEAREAREKEIDFQREKRRLERIRRRDIAKKTKMRRLLRHQGVNETLTVLPVAAKIFSVEDVDDKAGSLTANVGPASVSRSAGITMQKYDDAALSNRNDGVTPVEIGCNVDEMANLDVPISRELCEREMAERVPVVSGSAAAAAKRRVEQAPKQFQAAFKPRNRTATSSSTSHHIASVDSSSNLLRPSLKRANTFSASLCAAEVAAGFGMGMAVSSGPSFLRRQLSTGKAVQSSDGLFAAVTGKRGSALANFPENHSVKRIHKSTSAACVRVASAQYVFTHSSSATLDESSSLTTDSRQGTGFSSRPGLQRSQSTSRFGTSSSDHLSNDHGSGRSKVTGLMRQLSSRNSVGLHRSTSVVAVTNKT